MTSGGNQGIRLLISVSKSEVSPEMASEVSPEVALGDATLSS